MKNIRRICCKFIILIVPVAVYRLAKKFKRILWTIFDDLSSPVKVPLFKRIWAWRKGFPGDRIILYKLNKTNSAEFLPDNHYSSLHPINGTFSSLIDNKVSIRYALSRYKDFLPEYYLMIYNDQLTTLPDFPADIKRPVNFEVIPYLCQKYGRIIMKPLAQSHGDGVMMILFEDNAFYINGKKNNEVTFLKKCRQLKSYVITECINQHEYAKSLYPRTTNTIRILTMKDFDSGSHFIAAAVQRVGQSTTYPVDNFFQGGIAFPIDTTTGVIGMGLHCKDRVEFTEIDCHPETGMKIQGTTIPNWDIVRNKVLEMCSYLSVVPYMGWDIAVTDNGFKIVEINSLPDVRLFQIFSPLLVNDSIRNFYQKFFNKSKHRKIKS